MDIPVYHFVQKNTSERAGRKGDTEIPQFSCSTNEKLCLCPKPGSRCACILIPMVLQLTLDDITFKRVKKEKLPAAFNRREAKKVLSFLKGEFNLMASLIYSSGFRLTQYMKLRIKDIDFERGVKIFFIFNWL